jgi:hypothetical protein
LICGKNRLTVLPVLPPSITLFRCDNNPISRVMFPFPPSIKNRLMQHVFAGTHLQFFPDETLKMYQDRMMARSSNSGGVSTSPLVSAVYVAPPRGPGNAIPGGQGYVDTAAQYPGPDGAPGQKKLGGRRTRRTRRSKRTRSLKKRFRGNS